MPTQAARQSTTALSFDLTGIRPEFPNYLPTAHRDRYAWYEPCNAKLSRGVEFTRTVQTIVARND